MKKVMTLATIAAATLLTACTQTATNQSYGSNAGSNVLTISQAKSQADDSIVIVEGNIIRQVDGDEYILADSTGQIKVEIEAQQWNGLNVTSNEKIRVRGKLDNETFERADIDAFSVEKVQ